MMNWQPLGAPHLLLLNMGLVLDVKERGLLEVLGLSVGGGRDGEEL
jgi:hypothetical protein